MANTPEEKSKELIEKFKPYAPFIPYKDEKGNTWLYSAAKELINAKQCSIICVQEIIEALQSGYYTNTGRVQFWQQVLEYLNHK